MTSIVPPEMSEMRRDLGSPRIHGDPAKGTIVPTVHERPQKYRSSNIPKVAGMPVCKF